jgi:hypothetical protein
LRGDEGDALGGAVEVDARECAGAVVGLTETELRMLSQLRSFHRGQGLAIPRANLAALIGMESMRELRAARANLISALYPIGICEGGYYYCVTVEDFRATRCYTMKKVRGFMRQMRRERWAFEGEQQRLTRGREAEQLEAIHPTTAERDDAVMLAWENMGRAM